MKIGAIKEDTSHPDAMTMVRRLAEDQETVANTCRQVLQTADEAHDVATDDLLSERVKVHEKNAWMLRAHLSS
ncbi:MAG: ferritin-like domain-containing protein [Rhodovibrio sp.]|nr:ferritin-like domain-containing protein [Rhodovibrio sp.]